MKKGIIELQFNWIFVLIAGAVFLVFFGLIINGISKGSEQSLDYEIINYLDGITTSLESSPLTEHNINLLDKEINIDCDFLSIKNHNYEGISLKNKILFSPDSLKSEIKSYTLFWETPFKASYMMYATSPEVKYVIFEDPNNLYTKLWDSNNIEKSALPKGMEPEIKEDSENINGEGFTKLKIITINKDPNLIKKNINANKIKAKDISAIKIKPDGSTTSNFPDGFGTVEFYYFNGNDFALTNKLNYFNKASLIGAIYANDAIQYECNMNKAIAKMKLVAYSLKTKANNLKDKSEVTSKCSAINEYDKLIGYLNSAEGIILSTMDSSFYSNSNNIDSSNKILINAACPYLY